MDLPSATRLMDEVTLAFLTSLFLILFLLFFCFNYFSIERALTSVAYLVWALHLVIIIMFLGTIHIVIRGLFNQYDWAIINFFCES